VAVSDRLARGRVLTTGPLPLASEATVEPAPLRWPIVVGLAVAGVVLVVPTLIASGIPGLTEDITGARSELAGPLLQVLRVTVPALAAAIAIAWRPVGRPWLPWLAVAAILTGELLLGSRYLAAEAVAVVVVGLGLVGWRFQPRLVAAVVLAGLLAFAGIGVLRAYDQAAGRELAFAVERTVNRLFLIEPRTLEALQATIPDEEPFFGGLTWLRRLGPLVGRDDIPNLGYWIYPRVVPDQDPSGPPGYAAPGLIGEAWANFGVAGLALFAILGVALERVGALIAARRPAAGDVVAGSLASIFLARTHALGLAGVVLLLVLVLGWRLLAAGGWPATWAAARDVLRWRR
jgi:hypothetical protein